MTPPKLSAVSWVPRLDPMGGLLGSRGTAAPRPGERPAPPPAPAARPELRVVPPPAPPAPAPAESPALVLPCEDDDVEELVGLGAATEVPAPAEETPAPRAPSKVPAKLGPSQYTVRGVILRAACELAGGSTTTRVVLGDLVVRAWRLDSRLALRGHEAHHPDANRVYAKLCGPTGLVGMGLLARRGDGEVVVTRKGLAWWKAVST